MPFLEDKTRLRGGITPVPVFEKPEAPSFGDTLSAAFQRENEFGSMLAGDTRKKSPFNPDFDLGAAIKPEYRGYANAFLHDNSEEDIRHTERKIDREIKSDDTLRAAGGLGVAASIIAGASSPINWMPIGGTALAGMKAGRRMLEVGKTTGLAGFMSTTAQEALLHSMQPTRTKIESVFNVGGATVLSGLLGGAIGLLGKKEAAALGKRLEHELTIPPKGEDIFAPGEVPVPQSVGAAATNTGDEALKGALGMEKAIKFQDPSLRLQTGEFISGRRTVQEMVETPLTMRKNARGEATSPEGLGLDAPGAVETRIKMWTAPLGESLHHMDEMFQMYRLGKVKTLGVMRIGARDLVRGTDGKMGFAEFKTAVGHAMRNDDTHPVPEVDKAAKFFRKNLYDPLKERAIEVGVLDKDVSVDTAISYLNRVYDKDKIIAFRNDFHDRIMDHLSKKRDVDATKSALAQDLSDAQLAVSRSREQLQQLLFERDSILQRTRSKRKGKEARIKEANRGTKKAETEARRAKKRVDDITPTEFEDAAERVYYSKLLRDLRRGDIANPPRSLVKELRGTRGLKDPSGDLAAIVGGKDRLINNKSGESLESAAERMWEDGYFPDYADAPDGHDLLDAIELELKGEPLYSSHDIEEVFESTRIIELRTELDQLGFDVEKATPESLKAFMEGAEFKPNSPALKGKLVEANARVRRSLNSVENADSRVGNLEDDINALDDLIRTLKDDAPGKTDAIQTARAGMKKARTQLHRAKASQKLSEWRGSQTNDELADTANRIIDRILGTPEGRLPYDIDIARKKSGPRGDRPAGLRGPLKSRVFDIPDKAIEDFLESDIEMLSRMYTNTMASDVELTARFGDVNMTRQLAEISEEANEMIMRASSQKEKSRLENKKKAAMRDLGDIAKRLRGTYALPNNPDGLLVRTGRAIRSLNYLRLLGGMTLSATPDVARPVMIHGMRRVYGRALPSYLKNLTKAKLAANEVKLAGTAWDMILDTRTMGIANYMDDFGRHSKFERALHGATQQFGLVSLMAPWNAAIKQFSGLITISRILEQADLWRAGKIGAKEAEYLASSGIDAMMAKRIADAFDASGRHIEDGIHFANTEKWGDRGAVEAFRAAIVRDVDRIIVTPGQDKPLWMSTELGKMIGQFKTFSMASSQRTLLSGLQQRDMAALNGAVMAMAMGAFAYAIKQKVAGRDLSDNPAIWMAEAFDRSGLPGWIMEANNMSEKVTRGTVGLSYFTGRPISRYASRNAIGAALGPSAGTFRDFTQITGAGFSGDWREADTRALRRVIPLQNVFYLRWLFDNAEHGVNRVIGVK